MRSSPHPAADRHAFWGRLLFDVVVYGVLAAVGLGCAFILGLELP